ncbi:MAG: OmpA family protein [Bacteroidales bacterium]|nr:OmpA family protein [Bacteroidales bacterium]
MKTKTITSIIIISIFLYTAFSCTTLFAQYELSDINNTKFKYNTWSISGNFGSIMFYGDIREYDFYPTSSSEIGWGGGITLNKQISPFFGLHAQFLTGSLSGIKRSSNYNFSAEIFEYTLNSIFSITDIIFTEITDKKFNFYLLVGAGYVNFRSKLNKNGIYESGEGFSDNGTQKNKMTTELIIPVGLGVNYKLSEKIDLNFETTLRNLNSDKLDCYVSPPAKDKYGYTSLGITLKFGKDKYYTLSWISSKEKTEYEDLLAKANKKKIDSLNMQIALLNKKMSEMDSLNTIIPKVEPDDDGDGVPNSRDLEPDTPKGNLVNFQGVSLPKSKTDTIVKTQSDTIISESKEILFSIYFDFNSDVVKLEHKQKIAESAKMLKSNITYKLELLGHTDTVGGVAYNKALGARRIQAVFDILVDSYDINPRRLIRNSQGKLDPLSKKDDFINRRVDFIIIKD